MPRREPFKDGLASTGDAAEVLGVTRRMVVYLIDTGRLPAVERQWSHFFRIRVEDLETFAAIYKRTRGGGRRKPLTDHGTIRCWNRGCRCDPCKEANRAQWAEYRARNADQLRAADRSRYTKSKRRRKTVVVAVKRHRTQQSQKEIA